MEDTSLLRLGSEALLLHLIGQNKPQGHSRLKEWRKQTALLMERVIKYCDNVFSVCSRHLYTSMWIHLQNNLLEGNFLSQMQICICEILPSHPSRGYPSFESHQQHLMVPGEVSPDLTTQWVIQIFFLCQSDRKKMTSSDSFNLYFSYTSEIGNILFIQEPIVFFPLKLTTFAIFHLFYRHGQASLNTHMSISQNTYVLVVGYDSGTGCLESLHSKFPYIPWFGLAEATDYSSGKGQWHETMMSSKGPRGSLAGEDLSFQIFFPQILLPPEEKVTQVEETPES